MMKKTLGLAAVILLAACKQNSEQSRTDALQAGPIQTVNTYTQGDQQWPAISKNAAGQGVVAWDSFGQDGEHFGVFARLLQDGEFKEPEFQVNQHYKSRQNFADVAMAADGSFVVVWRSSQQGSPGGSIYARRYNAEGLALGDEFLVGPGRSEYDSQSEPAVAMNSQGDFVVVWSNRELSRPAVEAGLSNIETRMVQAQVFNAQGQSVRGPFSVSTPTPLAVVRAPDVAIDDQGRFAVVWVSGGIPSGIRMRHFSSTGGGEEASQTIDNQAEGLERDFPAIAMNASGEHVAVWESVFFSLHYNGVHGRQYAADHSPLDQAFQLAPAEQGFVERVSVSINQMGQYVVLAQANDQIHLLARNQRSEQIQQRLGSVGLASFPAVHLDDAGQISAVWQSYKPGEAGRDIVYQQLQMPDKFAGLAVP